MKSPPVISIVTPSFNQAIFIGEAMASVQLQKYRNFEHLVIDGGSTDGTLLLLRSLTTGEEGRAVMWLSEPDSGQSEALNKGFRQAKGEIIGWLNSDDRYHAGCFEQIVQAFADNPDADILYGDYLVVDESGKTLKIRREIEFSEFILLYHRVLYIPTTATFFRRKVFEENNWLDESLHYAMDLEFFIRLAARGYRFKHIPEILADFRVHPRSKSCRAATEHRMEHQQIVLGAAPVLRRLRPPLLRKTVLWLLRSIAGVERYSKKLLKGCYWQQVRLNGPSATDV
jgi:glycosyltransferase involved in cell wall biosynthesis